MIPSVIPGIAGTFLATATITITGGRRRIGLMLKLDISALLIASISAVEAAPLFATETPMTPNAMIQIP